MDSKALATQASEPDPPSASNVQNFPCLAWPLRPSSHTACLAGTNRSGQACGGRKKGALWQHPS
eukprot:5764750-Prorocentrum_lima.AAC.1